MSWRIGIGILLQGLSTLGVLSEGCSGLVRAIAYLQVVSVVVACTGAALILMGQRTAGARLVIAGSVLFVPLGLLAIFGARRVLDRETEASFILGE